MIATGILHATPAEERKFLSVRRLIICWRLQKVSCKRFSA